MAKSSLNEYSKTESLITRAETTAPKEGLRSEVSKHAGWVTVDEAKGMYRKNAPETEVGKQKLTAEAKRKNRPEWMTYGDHDKHVRLPGSTTRVYKPVARSLWDIDTYRHHFDT